jgi:hypothetical protein
MSYSVFMRNRPICQVIGTVVVFAVVQQYFEDPNSFFSSDRLLDVQYWLKWIIFLLLAVYALEKLGQGGRDLARVLIVDDDCPAASPDRPWPSLLGGVVFLITVLTVLELRQPFFFTQDDNLMQFLPVILQGCRSLLQGVLPTWNPYQLLGAPTTTVGVYSLTYPVTYFSYALSRYLLGNENFTIEIYCIFHIITGYFALYWAARCHRIRPSLAATAALCAVLSGWSLIATRSWFYVGPIFLYLPLLIVGVSKLTSGSGGWKWMGSMSVAIALFFYAGNVQFWVYGLLFLWIAIIVSWSCRLLRGAQVLGAVAATLLGVAFAFPLLLPQFLQTRDVFRTMVPDVGVLYKQWQAFFVPGPWIHAYDPANSVDPQWLTGGLIVYSGTTFVLLAALLVPCYFFYRVPRREIGQNVWFVCGVISFLAAIGLPGVIWPIMLRLPLLSKFRIPIKFLAFFDIFIVIVGAMILERLLRRVRWAKQVEICAVVATLVLLGTTGTMRLPSWYSYGIKPYPTSRPLIEQISGDHAHRVMSITFERSPSPRYWEEFPHNIGTVYNVPAFNGYDPLVRYAPEYRKAMERFEKEPVQTLQEYGVEYILAPADFRRPILSAYGGSHHAESTSLIPASVRAKVLAQTELVFVDDEISIRRIANARPLAYLETNPELALPVRLRADGFDLDTSSAPQAARVVANFLWYPESRAEADGRPLVVTQDSYQRIVFDLPASTKQVRIRFAPAWWKGFAIGAFVACAGMLLGYFAVRSRREVKLLAAAAAQG